MKKMVIIFFEFYKKLIVKIYIDKGLDDIIQLNQIIDLIKKGEIDFSDNSVFYELNQKTSLNKLSQVISHFRFVSVERYDNVVLFARNSNYNFNYVSVVNSGKILIVSDEGDILFEIAKNEESFLKVLICMCEYEMMIGKIAPDNIASDIKQRAIKYAGGEVYKDYYDLIF